MPIALFLRYLVAEKRLSRHTVLAYKTDLTQFYNYLSHTAPSITLETSNHKILRKWIMAMVEKKISCQSINRKIACLKTFYKFLLKQKLVNTNPALTIKTLKTTKALPSFIQQTELAKLLDHCVFSDTWEGCRDKLILELFYGTGIRLSELINLHSRHVNLVEKTIKVSGKCNKERIIPFPAGLTTILEKYNRQKTMMGLPNDLLFTTSTGKPCYAMMIYRIVRKYLRTYTSSDKHSPHVLRHTYATHLLNNGADLNAIKVMLGHKTLSATQVYTHNALDKLKTIFTQAHPRA